MIDINARIYSEMLMAFLTSSKIQYSREREHEHENRPLTGAISGGARANRVPPLQFRSGRRRDGLKGNGKNEVSFSVIWRDLALSLSKSWI